MAEVQGLVAERRIADGQGEPAILQGNLLETGVQNGGLRVQGLGDAGRQAVVLHGDELGIAAQVGRRHAHEVAGSSRRFQHGAALEPQPFGGFPHGPHHRLGSVVGVQGGSAGGIQFALGQQAGQFIDPGLPPFLD